ncbi:lipoprotein signal peptidase [Flavobacterium eburneipallidum]|uniref:lipoprotein signal peptidase n=1 Tax=Flavobacterium eburneipallidum TaxID=3003263 RepID=UPI0022AC3F85|nr:lipoprotein signal peptidase [Flavobacterium eburneipallidum]
MSLRNAYLIVFILLLVDQFSKIYIKTNFILGQEVEVFSWFKIHFVENEGMAWGTEIPGTYGKLILSLFRLLVVPVIGYWLWDSVERKHSSNYLVVAISLILAGALGNIIDSVFYGVIFDDSSYQLATLFSDKPYGTWLYGKVVDMFYFPLFEGNWPEWIPVIGGQHFKFFNAIFNIADVAISTGVGILIVFNKKAFHHEH